MERYTEQFAKEVVYVYQKLAKDYWLIGRDQNGNPCLPDNDQEIRQLIRIAIARCGAGVGAAIKRAKRRLVLDELVATRDSGMDITPAVAQGTANRLLGRGFSTRETARLFSIAGRTAANKSTVTANDLEKIEKKLSNKLSLLISQLEEEKRIAHANWATSPERKKIMEYWSMQRVNAYMFF